MVGAREGRTTHVQREHQVFGKPDGFEAEPICLAGDTLESGRVEQTQSNTELHYRRVYRAAAGLAWNQAPSSGSSAVASTLFA